MIDPDNLPYRTRLVLASEDILELWGTRTEDGDRITVEWGERRPEGWYEPAFTRHADDRLGDHLDAELERLRRIEAAARALNSKPEQAVTDAAALAALRTALAPEGSARDG